MEFKRYGGYYLLSNIVINVISIMVYLWVCIGQTDRKVILFCVLCVLGFNVWYLLCIPGLFLDNVSVDSDGITFEIHKYFSKKIAVYAWKDIIHLKKINNSGNLMGFFLLTSTGEELDLFPIKMKTFLKFMESRNLMYLIISTNR